MSFAKLAVSSDLFLFGLGLSGTLGLLLELLLMVFGYFCF